MRGGMPRKAEIEAVLRRIAPRIPHYEACDVRDHAMDSNGLRSASAQTATWLSLTAHVRHVHTDYDELLAAGYDVESARHFVLAEMEAVLAGWGVRRKVVASDES